MFLACCKMKKQALASPKQTRCVVCMCVCVSPCSWWSYTGPQTLPLGHTDRSRGCCAPSPCSRTDRSSASKQHKKTKLNRKSSSVTNQAIEGWHHVINVTDVGIVKKAMATQHAQARSSQNPLFVQAEQKVGRYCFFPLPVYTTAQKTQICLWEEASFTNQ